MDKAAVGCVCVFVCVCEREIMEYYSAIKRNAIESVLIRWMNLEPIVQSEVSERER